MSTAGHGDGGHRSALRRPSTAGRLWSGDTGPVLPFSGTSPLRRVSRRQAGKRRALYTAHMTTITLALSDDSALKLEELAKTAGVQPTELLRVRVEEWLAQPGIDFAEAAAYVLNKNAELYRRLA